jgi:hypothetical protein
MFLAQHPAKALASHSPLGCNAHSPDCRKDTLTMRRLRNTFALPDFETSSLALIAFVVLMNAQPVRAQVGFGPGPATPSTPAATTKTQAPPPAPATKPPAASAQPGSAKPPAAKKAASQPKS